MNTPEIQVSLPTLSSELFSKLQHKEVEPPPAAMLTAPETILQMGWGKFLRGYTPDFVQLANRDGNYHGRILAVQREMDDRWTAAQHQGGLYTLVLRGIEDGSPVEIKRIIGAVSRLLVAKEHWAEIESAARKRDLRVIVTNATETGWKFDPEDRIDLSPPRSFPGRITQLLFERWKATSAQDADIAIIPTELVLDNGPLVQRLLVQQASAWKLGDRFEHWLRTSVHVASTLVDRIVVGTPRPDLLAQECEAVGYRDDLLTCGEPYYLFAIQADEFTQRSFPMNVSTPNVRFVDDLAPYRRRKLRLLNGPQMVLSTLGTLLDFTLVREVVKDPQVGAFTERTVWEEIIPAMGPEDESVNSQYARECYQRIGNPTIEHRLQGIRMELTTKNAIRLFPSIRDFISRRDALPGRLLLTVAATLATALKIQLQDVNAEYIALPWSETDPASRESLIEFTRKALVRLCESSHEQLDVEKVSPETADLLREIRNDGLRAVLARHYPSH
jgi:tagaturonate reductase